MSSPNFAFPLHLPQVFIASSWRSQCVLMASILCLATTSHPHLVFLKSSMHPYRVLIASLWLLSYVLRQLCVPIASSSSPHCILMVFSLRPYGLYLISCDNFASPLHPPQILIVSSWHLSYVCPPHCVFTVSLLHPPCIPIASL